MSTYPLKLNAQYYEDSQGGIRNFEIRKSDRDYKVGDILELQEYSESWVDGERIGRYSGKFHGKIVTYVSVNEEYLESGYVILGVAPIKTEEVGE